MVPSDESHELEDERLQEEIVLLGELMAAAAGATQHLGDQQIDEVIDGVVDDPLPGDEPDKAVGGADTSGGGGPAGPDTHLPGRGDRFNRRRP